MQIASMKKRARANDCATPSIRSHPERLPLETETRLQLDDAARQPRGGAAEVDVVDVRARAEEAERREVQHVEGVEEIRPQLERRVLAERVEARQARALHQAQVNAAIVRPAEDVAPYPRRAIGRVRGVEEALAAAGEVTAERHEGFVVRVGQRAAEILRRSRRAEVRAARRADAIADQRRPREA